MTRPDPITHGLWLMALTLLCLIPLASLPLGYQFNTAKGVGWTANLAVLPAFLFALSLRGFSKVASPPAVRWMIAGALAFTAYAVGGLFFGPNNFIISGGAILGILGGFGAGLGAYQISRSGEEVLPRVFRLLLLGSLPLLTLPLLVAYMLEDYSTKEWLLKLPGFGNPRSLGHYSAIIVVVLIGLSAAVTSSTSTTTGRVRRIVHFAGLVAAWSILLWSGSRGGVLAVAIGVPIACLVLWRVKIFEVLYNTCALIVGGALSLLYIVPHSSYSVLGRSVQLRDTIDAAAAETASKAIDNISSGRLELWKWSIGKILEKPIAGWSYLPMPRMRTLDPDTVPPLAHAHNIALDYAMGFGLPIALLVFAVVFMLWLKSRLGVSRTPSAPHLAAFYLATVLPVYSLLSAVLILPFQLAIFGICIGGLIGAEAWRLRVEAGDLPRDTEDSTTAEDKRDGMADDAVFV